MEFTHGKHVIEWVNHQISDKIKFCDEAVGMGVEQNGKILAGVVFDEYRIDSNSICISYSVIDKKAVTRKFIKAIFVTAFNLIGVSRITGFIEQDNFASLELAKRFGFQHEGIMRKASYNKKDLYVFGMLKQECKWI